MSDHANERLLAVLDRIPVEAGSDLAEVRRRRQRSVGPPHMPSAGRRIIVGLLALAVFVAGGVLLWRTRSGEPRPLSPHPSPTLVPSGGSYVLSDVGVRHPVKLTPREEPRDDLAEVTFTSEWTTEFFPGEAECVFEALDADGRVLGRTQGSFSMNGPGPERISVKVWVEGGKPSQATASCGPGKVFVGSEYLFSDVRTSTDRVIADVRWSAGTPVGTAACAVRVVPSDSEPVIRVFTLDVPPGDDQTIVLWGNVPFDPSPEVRCEPYRLPEQVQIDHWLPWP